MGWRPYDGSLGLMLPFLRNFYRQTSANYPNVAGRLSVSWIFDACMESLGWEDGPVFLAQLHEALAGRHVAERAESNYEAW